MPLTKPVLIIALWLGLNGISAPARAQVIELKGPGEQAASIRVAAIESVRIRAVMLEVVTSGHTYAFKVDPAHAHAPPNIDRTSACYFALVRLIDEGTLIAQKDEIAKWVVAMRDTALPDALREEALMFLTVVQRKIACSEITVREQTAAAK